MSALVEVEHLTKVYPDGTRAVDDVSFGVARGETFGFLGPNGAGKTTTIRILVTLLPKTGGTASVGGFDVDRRPEDIRAMIGYAGQFIGVDVDLTGRENLVLQGRLHGMSARDAARRADELLEVFALQEAASRRAGAYSGGMRRRLDLAQALVHQPPLVFLDEPTTGLDPQTRNALWRHLEELNENGTTIFLTTQYLEEADRLCRRLSIIDHGRIVVTGSPEDLKREVGGEVVTVTLPEHAGDDHVQRALTALSAFPGSGQPATFDHSVALPLADAGRRLSELIRHLDDAGVAVEQLGFTRPTLDEVFLKYTGERMRVETESRAQSSASRTMMGQRRWR
jgi:daunorubicin resistance ABC transporter ATP-binding subunit